MRKVPILLGAIGLVAASLVLRTPATAAPQPDGAAAYKRCAACHLATGAGVPGAFPPLAGNVRALAQSADGRKYMALVVIKGLSGPLTVEGKAYRGVMPAQGDLNDTAIAALLDHVVTNVAKGKARPFTTAEIASARKSAAALNAAGIGKLKPSVGAK
jgi:mono/diheme cytochrome c family protein